MAGAYSHIGVLVVPLAVIALGTSCSSSSTKNAETSSVATSAASSASAASSVSAAPAADGACAKSAYPLLKLGSRSPAEPALAIPQPPGWESSTEMNSDIIRGAIASKDLVADGFAPNAVVTLEDLTGKVATPQAAIDGERASVTAEPESQTPGSLCGHPSLTITYNSPATETAAATAVTTLIVASEEGGKIYAATVSVQTADPSNTTYINDKQAILDGFQFGAPA
ncbi:LpqN/LpqT family lipoprotein [Mycolicibacterium sp. CH28]|uniref:LpqN/LpqT family lipoprotein n=1 Tax=Mycolicibacterium sp. CH28 TaxID=2512237 RepID=UPI001F261976|nr:LpqN/LpqT family lipoprotein [Mycolicibacterium sp. CH28]